MKKHVLLTTMALALGASMCSWLGVLCQAGTIPLPDIAWWQMDAGLGGTVPDAAVNHLHPATVSGTPVFDYDASIGRRFVQFDGSSWLTVAPANDLDMTGNWTMAFWTKPGELFNNVEIWLRKSLGYHDDKGGYSIILDGDKYGQGNRIGFTVFHGIGNNQDFYTGDALTLPGWNHVAVTHDVANGETDFYVNGRLRATTTMGLVLANPYPLIMGADVTDLLPEGGVTVNPEYRSKGALADVRLYSYVLSADQVAAFVPDNGDTILLVCLAFFFLLVVHARSRRSRYVAK